MKFKVGDKVRVVRHTGDAYNSKIGIEGFVSSYKYGEYPVFVDLSEAYEFFCEEDLELIEPKREFKVGDRVRILSDCSGCIKGEDAIVQMGCNIGSNMHSMYAVSKNCADTNRGGCNCKNNWELIEEKKEPVMELSGKEVFHQSVFEVPSTSGIIKLTNERISSPKKTIMSNIIEFAKNLTLSEDEKLLRKHCLKDSEGNWNNNAKCIVLDLEAQELDYKDIHELEKNVGCAEILCSPFDLIGFYKKYESKLIEIAKAKEEEEKKK